MGINGDLLNRNAHGGRTKKLIAGIWFSLYISDSGEKKTEYKCNDCTQRMRHKRNCHNRKGLLHGVLLKQEWLENQSNELEKHQVRKFSELKFYQCPLSFVTPKTWRVLQLVNDTTDGDCNIIQLPFPGAYSEQPSWYKEAVRIVKTARAEHQRAKRK